MITIRKAGPKDAEAIAHVHITAWRETYQGIVPDDFLKDLSTERRAKYWEQSLSDPEGEYHNVLAAEVDGAITGFVNYGDARETDLGCQGELFAIYILRAVQKLGLGRRLFSDVVRAQLDLGVSSMMLWVLKENPSRGFYEHLGGIYLTEKTIEIGGKELIEVAYGWQDLRRFQRG